MPGGLRCKECGAYAKIGFDQKGWKIGGKKGVVFKFDCWSCLASYEIELFVPEFIGWHNVEDLYVDEETD